MINPRSMCPDNLQKILCFSPHLPSCPSLESTYSCFLAGFIPNLVLREIPFFLWYQALQCSPPPQMMIIVIACSKREKKSFMDDIFILFFS